MPYIGLSVKYQKKLKKKGYGKYLSSSNPHAKGKEAGRQEQSCVRWRCISTLFTLAPHAQLDVSFGQRCKLS